MAVKGTIRQKRVARRIKEAVESDEKITVGEILRQEGYSENISRQPSRVINSPGVQEELAAIGFTPENARVVVGQILLDSSNKPEPRLKAAEIIFKVHGSFAPERTESVVAHIDVNERLKALAAKLNK